MYRHWSVLWQLGESISNGLQSWEYLAPTVRWGGEHGKLLNYQHNYCLHLRQENQQLCRLSPVLRNKCHTLSQISPWLITSPSERSWWNIMHMQGPYGMICNEKLLLYSILSVCRWYFFPDISSKWKCQSVAQDTDTIKCECLFTGVPARIFLNIYHSSPRVKVISLPLSPSDDS